jgi:hypothetical protein
MKCLPVFTLIIAGLLGHVGCASPAEESETEPMAQVASASLLPWKEGNRWSYRVTKDGKAGTKDLAVGPEEQVGGTGPNRSKKANRVISKQDDGDQAISWQARDGERVVRYREHTIKADSKTPTGEEHWAPSKLHVDDSAAHTALGASWTDEYVETKQSKKGDVSTSNERDEWSVVSIDDVVTVPAGTFRAIVLQRGGGDTPKKYWFVRGVGKVKETGDETEELVSYQLAP